MIEHENSPKIAHYVFKLYIAGMNGRSIAAIGNLKKMCEEYLPHKYEIKVIDLLVKPESARIDDIIATPTLIKTLPLPVRKLIGDLSDSHEVRINLEIKKVIK
ncbi:MAG: circadian clock KaiB family protein [Parachlamydiaceae bacterium]